MNNGGTFVPDGYAAVTPHLAVAGADRLIRFLIEAFDAAETERVLREDGTIGHAEVRVGGAFIMVAEPAGDLLKPTRSGLYLYVPDTDASFQRAIDAGALVVMKPVDAFHGERNAGIEDPFGNRWWLATPLGAS